MPSTRSVRIGIHGRNDPWQAGEYPDSDYQMAKRANLEAFKGFSYTKLSAYQRLKKENPGLEITIRLDWGERVNTGGHPTPEEMRDKFVPIMNQLRSVCERYEVLNEPNHVDLIGGWGPTDEHAKDFNTWFLKVYDLLKSACSWAKIGFPGLAVPEYPHRDQSWIKICKDAIERADWLGVHCYWQDYDGVGRHLSDDWGLIFKKYHQAYPKKIIDITECGNSNGQSGQALAPDHMAKQYVEYYQELFKYPYINSVHPFIISSPDDTWNNQLFVWVKKDGSLLPVVGAVGDMQRPSLVQPVAEGEEEPLYFPYFGGRHVQGLFKDFFEAYGLDICGYPVTEEFVESGLLSQYFQRVALETVKKSDGGDTVRLKLVGQYYLENQDKVEELQKEVEQLKQSGGVAGPPSMKNVTDELPRHATKKYGTRSLDQITTIAINHTGSQADITPEKIASYQVKTKDMPGISYHFFIAADGSIFQTNTLETVSDHVGQFSPESVGIGFAGTFTDYIPTDAQLVSGGQLCAYLLQTLDLEIGAIKGAQELITTVSPGKQWLTGSKWKDRLLEQTRKAMSSLTPDLETLNARIAELQSQATALQTTVSQQQATINERQATIESQQAKISQQQAAINEQKAAVESQQTKISQQQATISQQQAEIEKLKEQVTPKQIPVVQPDIKDITTQLTRSTSKTYSTRTREAIKYLVMHHSGVAPETTAWDLAEIYVNNFSWPGLGFHYFVTTDGIIQQTNALTTISWHSKEGDATGIGICLAGNFNETVPPAVQIRAAAHLCAYLLQELKLGSEAIKSHKDYADIDCPGKQWDGWGRWQQSLLTEVASVQKTGGKATSTTIGKTIEHYVLFWQQADSWAEADWQGAQKYIGRFRPTCGFSVDDAAKSRYVTIIGGQTGVSADTEQFLKQAGCTVERIDGADEADTKRILDELAEKGQRFYKIVPG